MGLCSGDLEARSLERERQRGQGLLERPWGYSLDIFGPGRRVVLGHEHAVGQDGTHDEHVEERGAVSRKIPAGANLPPPPAGPPPGPTPPGQGCQVDETRAPRRHTGALPSPCQSLPSEAGHLPCSTASDRDQTLEFELLAESLVGPIPEGWMEGTSQTSEVFTFINGCSEATVLGGGKPRWQGSECPPPLLWEWPRLTFESGLLPKPICLVRTHCPGGKQETASLAVASFAQAFLSWPLLHLVPCFSPSRSSSSGRSALTPCLLHPQGTGHPSVSMSASLNDSFPLFPPEGELFKCHDCVLGILGHLASNRTAPGLV